MLKSLATNTGIEVRIVEGKGRGVFATQDFKFKDVIEVCPVVVVDCEKDEPNPFVRYVFRWSRTKVALLMGFGSLYNHAHVPNVKVLESRAAMIAKIVATRDIKAGEELCFNYTGSRTKPGTDVGFGAVD